MRERQAPSLRMLPAARPRGNTESAILRNRPATDLSRLPGGTRGIHHHLDRVFIDRQHMPDGTRGPCAGRCFPPPLRPLGSAKSP